VIRTDVLTTFPRLFDSFLAESFVAIARERGGATIAVHDLRGWATDRHRSVDDSPYGGGPGMVMRPEPLIPAIEALAGPKAPGRFARVIALSPQGTPLAQSRLLALATEAHLVLVCGRYEGIDQRVLDLAVDEEISIGDYVLSGGEVPAMVIVEGIARLLPGVLGNPESSISDSFGEDLLEGPHYTRPPVYRGLAVPEVLRSGDHAAIERWRRQQAIERTRQRRPDLLSRRQGNGGDE
jgi:tRNA (guanine37-N1)-methyltransferase